MKRITSFLFAMLLACTTNLWAVDFSQTYSYAKNGPTGWSLTNYSDESSYYLVPNSGTTSVATIPGIFTDKTITSEVVVTLNVATYGNGTNPSANTFSLYTSDDFSTQVTATQGGALPTDKNYKDVTYTVTKENATALTNDLAIKITKPGKQIRLKSITVAFSYEASNSATLTAIAISIPEDVQLKKEYIVGTSFDVTGIKAIATYDDASEKDVTEDVTWKLNPETFESVATNASVKVTASIDGEMSNELEITGITVRNLYNYTITWVVNGVDYNEGTPTTNVTEGDQITALPTAPADNTLSCSNIFVGWSTNNLGSTAGQSQPEDIFTSASAAPAITENTTFHAVFATADGEATEFFKETFDQTDGTGGNDGSWSGSIATSKLITDNTGWTFTKEGGANKCAKIGASKEQGSATTPALADLTGNAVLTFRAGAWDGDSTTLNLSISEGSLSDTTVTLTNAAFSEYSINITGATAQSKITFQGLQANKARFFLDDVVVKSNPLKDFRTNCEDETAIDNAVVETPAVKTIENGQLIILRDGVKYNAMGVRLQ